MNISRFLVVYYSLSFTIVHADEQSIQQITPSVNVDKFFENKLNPTEIQQEIKKNIEKFDLDEIKQGFKNHIDLQLRDIDDNQEHADNKFIQHAEFEKSWNKKNYNGRNIEEYLNSENKKIYNELQARKIAHELLEWSNSDIGSKDKEYLTSISTKLLDNESKFEIDTETYFKQTSLMEPVSALKNIILKQLPTAEYDVTEDPSLENPVNQRNMQEIYKEWVTSDFGNRVFEGQYRSCTIIFSKGAYNTCTNKAVYQRILPSRVKPDLEDIANPFFKEGYCIETDVQKFLKIKTVKHFCCFKSPIEKAYQLNVGNCSKKSCPGIPIEKLDSEGSFNREWFDKFVVKYFRK